MVRPHGSKFRRPREPVKRPDAMNPPSERQLAEAEGADADPARVAFSAILRTVAFFGFWLVLTDAAAADLAAGIAAAIAAAWASLRLMPPQSWDMRPLRVVGLVLRFFCQTAIAGIDVAWRALDPRLPLRPGIVTYHPLLPPGVKRNTFLTIMSLMPGTLPSGATDDGGIAIHCLDVAQPVAEQLATEEALFVRALGGMQDND
jgi:multicomponent Na+:H+ antiporter subunit E